jgi:hypothetical protein
MAATVSSETSTDFQRATRRFIAQAKKLHFLCCSYGHLNFSEKGFTGVIGMEQILPVEQTQQEFLHILFKLAALNLEGFGVVPSTDGHTAGARQQATNT